MLPPDEGANPLGNFIYGYYGITPRLHTVSNDQNGLNSSYSYQTGTGQDYRLTDLTNYATGTTVLSKFDYSYNPDGAIAMKQEQTDSSTPTLWSYGYDQADQLKSAVRTNTSTNAVLSQYVYGYDPAGNRTSEQNGQRDANQREQLEPDHGHRGGRPAPVQRHAEQAGAGHRGRYDRHAGQQLQHQLRRQRQRHDGHQHRPRHRP
jgi:hypothetical protein